MKTLVGPGLVVTGILAGCSHTPHFEQTVNPNIGYHYLVEPGCMEQNDPEDKTMAMVTLPAGIIKAPRLGGQALDPLFKGHTIYTLIVPEQPGETVYWSKVNNYNPDTCLMLDKKYIEETGVGFSKFLIDHP